MEPSGVVTRIEAEPRMWPARYQVAAIPSPRSSGLWNSTERMSGRVLATSPMRYRGRAFSWRENPCSLAKSASRSCRCAASRRTISVSAWVASVPQIEPRNPCLTRRGR